MMLVHETFANATKDYLFGNSGPPYEPFTDDIGRLFRFLQKEYGKCISKVYTNGPNGEAVPHGWVFQKTMQYEDAGRFGRKVTADDYYVREVWVTLYDTYESKTVVTSKIHDLRRGR